MVLICISLMSNGVEYLCMFLLAISMSLWKNVYTGILQIYISLFLMFSCMSCLYVLDMDPYWSYHWQIFSPIK